MSTQWGRFDGNRHALSADMHVRTNFLSQKQRASSCSLPCLYLHIEPTHQPTTAKSPACPDNLHTAVQDLRRWGAKIECSSAGSSWKAPHRVMICIPEGTAGIQPTRSHPNSSHTDALPCTPHDTQRYPLPNSAVDPGAYYWSKWGGMFTISRPKRKQ